MFWNPSTSQQGVTPPEPGWVGFIPTPPGAQREDCSWWTSFCSLSTMPHNGLSNENLFAACRFLSYLIWLANRYHLFNQLAPHPATGELSWHKKSTTVVQRPSVSSITKLSILQICQFFFLAKIRIYFCQRPGRYQNRHNHNWIWKTPPSLVP